MITGFLASLWPVRDQITIAGVHYQTIDITTDAEARDYVMALGYLFSCRFENVSSMLGDGTTTTSPRLSHS